MALALYHSPSMASRAQHYASWCELHPAETPPSVAVPALWLDDTVQQQGLGLLMPEFSAPFYVADEMVAARHKGRALVTRACGNAGSGQTLLDPFAGYGLDAMTLAQAGFEVTAVEREQVVWLLLQDVVARQGLAMQTEQGDGPQLLHQTQRQWDVIYLDPMFPPRNKRALPNRGLQHLQALTGEGADDVDLEALLKASLRVARVRVVLKRRARDPVIARPAYQIKGQAVRFDVYV